ncbi:MAG: metallophosphoesterase family protein [Bacteroidota bacterium]|nr:metallophosphoesterase family protein [Bacteroidota bacterium]
MRIGFISDIHEDIESLRGAFLALERMQCDEVVCLGDIVGFTLPFQRHIRRRDANACLAMVRAQCAVVVAGNHDLFAARRTPDYDAGFVYGANWYALDYDERARRSRNRVWLYEDSEMPHFLSPASRDYLASLPEFAVTEFDGERFFLSHFHYPDLSGSRIDSLRRARHLRRHFTFINGHRCTLSFSGHGHPEGCARSNHAKLRFLPFGSYVIDGESEWIAGPCVANTTRANGMMMFDTATRQLDVIPLASRKTIV